MDFVLLEASLAAAIHDRITILGVSRSFDFALFCQNRSAKKTLRINQAKVIIIQDLSLPRTMVQRLAKGVLPSNTQIQKDALTAMSKAATVFVNYLSQA